MADWSKILSGALDMAKSVARATIFDFDPTTRHAWISQFAIAQALRIRNSRVGFFGFVIDATIIDGYGIRVDVTTKPIGSRHSFVIGEACAVVDPTTMAFLLTVIDADAEVSLLLKVLPYLLGVLFGFRGSEMTAFVEKGIIVVAGPIPNGSWFIQLLRSLGGLRQEAQVPIVAANHGVVIDLSQIAKPGVLLDVGSIARNIQLNASQNDD